MLEFQILQELEICDIFVYLTAPFLITVNFVNLL